MEDYTTTHYLMWKSRTKFPCPSMNNSFISPADFQEPFGGFIWPPRSYTCSFCRREFRSAQALGGHMNVHRRDRAKLKQSSPPQRADSEIPHRQEAATRFSALENSFHRQSLHLQVPPTTFIPFMNAHEEILVEENTRRSGKPAFRDDEDFVETKLSMGVDDFVDGGNVICKRYKKSSIVSSSSLPFLHGKLCSSERCSTNSSMEDIDLELRLGNSPAVK